MHFMHVKQSDKALFSPNSCMNSETPVIDSWLKLHLIVCRYFNIITVTCLMKTFQCLYYELHVSQFIVDIVCGVVNLF